MKKYLGLLAMAILALPAVSPASSHDFRLFKDDAGPIFISVSIDRIGKNAQLTAAARNESGRPVRYARFCVRSSQETRGCDFRLQTTGTWEPGQEIRWNLAGGARVGIERPITVLTELRVDRMASPAVPPYRKFESVSPLAESNTAEVVFAQAAPKIVYLLTESAGQSYKRGSGIILTADGYVATNYHVVQGADAVEVRFFANPVNSDDYQSFNSVKLLYADQVRDIAILKVNSTFLPYLECPVGGCQSRVGETAYAIGNPKGLSNTISNGIVSALRTEHDEDWIQHTAAISHGSSGGALVDANGALLGMNTWFADGQNLNFAISAKHLVDALSLARRATAVLSFPPEAVPAASETVEEKAWRALLSNDYIQATIQSEQALSSGVSNPKIYTVLGLANLARGKSNDAEQYFRQAIVLLAPDDEFKETSRLELLRILGDRFNANRASVDTSAFIELVNDFLGSNNGFWYRDNLSVSLIGNPASDPKVWVNPSKNPEMYNEVRAWAGGLTEQLQ